MTLARKSLPQLEFSRFISTRYELAYGGFPDRPAVVGKGMSLVGHESALYAYLRRFESFLDGTVGSRVTAPQDR